MYGLYGPIYSIQTFFKPNSATRLNVSKTSITSVQNRNWHLTWCVLTSDFSNYQCVEKGSGDVPSLPRTAAPALAEAHVWRRPGSPANPSALQHWRSGIFRSRLSEPPRCPRGWWSPGIERQAERGKERSNEHRIFIRQSLWALWSSDRQKHDVDQVDTYHWGPS